MHRVRRELDGRTPVHVTLRLLPEVGRLRRREKYKAIRDALARTAHRDDCRIVHYSVQENHLHLIAEPRAKRALSSGMIAFKTSCARRLNGVVGRSGRVFADRYHVRYLTNLAQVRAAPCYVLNNWRRHGETTNGWRTDPFSSADFFDGWKGIEARRPWWLAPDETPPVAGARFWVLSTGWKQHGAIATLEVPGR
jgi:REP element-mobilizing transposase RayT